MNFKLLNMFLFFSSVFSHMTMKDPAPRKSMFSDYYLSHNKVDYNIVAPLNDNNYSYPCKGFKKGPSTKTINTNKIDITIDGNAPHGGGHCQFGISFDNKNFVVLKQVIRTCLIPDGLKYSFNLPVDFPDSNITVFWTWINAIGNREYYMDCADVKIRLGNPPKDISIIGKEIIIANLPEYPIIPEFPNEVKLLLNAPTKKITLNKNDCTKTSTTTTKKIPSTTTKIPSTTTKIPSTTTKKIPSTTTKIPSTTTTTIIPSTKTTDNLYSYAIKNNIKFCLLFVLLIFFIIIN